MPDEPTIQERLLADIYCQSAQNAAPHADSRSGPEPTSQISGGGGSQVFSLDAAAGWARAVSRWYRLAQPFAAFEAELIASMGMQSDGPHAMTTALPGFQPVSELERIPELLAASRGRIREIDAIDRSRGTAADEGR